MSRATESMLAAALALAMAMSPGALAAQETPEPSPPAPSQIEARTVTSNDADIAARIQSIFGEVEALRAVEVRVSAGVVTLRGSVPAASDIERAGTIASRVAGVVTVQNNIVRSVDVDTTLTPVLTQFGEDLQSLVRALPLIGVAIGIGALIVLLGYLLAARDRLWRWIAPNVFLAELLATAVRFAAVMLGFVVALQILGATALLGAVLGGAGVIGIAVGFAVRDTVDNYVSSLMLSLRQPFRANDHVVIESHEGRVVRLTSRATILMTLDGNHLRIPNSTVFKAVILNYTRNPQRRFEFDLGIDAADDPVDGMAVGLAALDALDFVLDDPRPTAVIRNVGDSNIVLRFFGWLDQTKTDFLKGRSLALNTAKNALETSGFALPEPIYRLRFDAAAPLQFKQAPTVAEAPKPQPKAPAAVMEAAEDTAPDAHVERLVKEERAESPQDDLLDSHRPIE